MTDHQFLTIMAKRLATTPDYLRSRGYMVTRCNCGWPECLGWQLVPHPRRTVSQ